MNFKYFVSEIAHPFILYVLFGTLISYFIIKLIFKLLKFNDARSRVYLLFLPFLLPLTAFALLKNIYNKQCITGVDYSHQTVSTINQWLCSFGNAAANYITPLFLVTGVLAVTKAIISLAACKRMIFRYGFAESEQYPGLCSILEKLCHKADIEIPKVIVTPDKYAKSFTFGFRSPVIVISAGIIKNLDEDELEAVLAHELAHIIRSDSMLNWITVFLRDLMFFTPVIYWLFRDLSREKEHATDDIAIMLSEKPLALAGALVKVWRMSPKGFFKSLAYDNFMPYPQFAASEGALEGRITRIMGHNQENLGGLSKVFILGGIIATASIFVLYFVC